MEIVVGRSNLRSIGRFRDMAEMLASPRAKKELHRGVVDAGRKVKTKVQRAVVGQMGLLPGNYSSYVVAGTRGISRPELLAFDIFGVKGGTNIEKYRGLRSVKSSNKLNVGRKGGDRGVVRSSVWNNPRIFKRSFEANGEFYATRPASAGTSKVAPRVLWTYGAKPNQPRTAQGRFAATGVQYGKVRKLFGPSLMMEIPQDKSLATFLREGPIELERSVMKRVTKLMRY